jgi:hypothetical protein
MRCYCQLHKFYCGVDLHARTLFIHVLDHKGKTVFEKDLPANPAAAHARPRCVWIGPHAGDRTCETNRLETIAHRPPDAA